MRFLLDEMLPPATTPSLETRGHDGLTVVGAGLAGVTDREVFDFAVATNRVLVTENVADYTMILERRLGGGEPAVPVVFVHRPALPKRGALAEHLARRLDRWASANPEPYVGPHWP